MTISFAGAKGVPTPPPQPPPPRGQSPVSKSNKIANQPPSLKEVESQKRGVVVQENRPGENTQIISAQQNAHSPEQFAKQLGLLLDQVV